MAANSVLCRTIRFASICALLLLSVSPICPQPANLAAPGDGSDLYYALRLNNAFSSSLYKVGTSPPSQILGVLTPVFPLRPLAGGESAYYISPYFQLSNPQFSSDGSVSAFTGKRVCLGGAG